MMMDSMTNKYETKQEYIEWFFNLALQYEADVLSGKIIANKWIKLAIKRRKKLEKKYLFKEEEVKKALSFFYYVFISNGSKPQRFEPLPWMAWIIYNVYGYYRKDEPNKKLFRYVNIWVSRKNAKTTLASIFSLYALVKGQREAEVYFCATTKDQASQALRYLKQIVSDSPALRKRVRKLQYKLVYEGNGNCVAKPVANEPDKLDGLKPTFAIIDEKHAMPTNDLFNIMKTGILASQDPQIVTISTAGFRLDYPFYQEIDLGKKVLQNELEDDATFYAFYTLDDESEIEDPNMWEKANPSIKKKDNNGFLNLSDLVVDFKKASMTIVDKKNFIVKNLNVFVDGEDTWIPDEDYRRCFNEVDLKDFVGQKVYLGMDLSRSRDLASLVAIFYDEETGKINVFPEFYFPNDSYDKKIRPSGIDLTEWIDKGYIQEHRGKIIDFDAIFDRIQYYNDNFEVMALGYDPWFAVSLVSRCEEELLIDMIPCKQNTAFYTFPMKYFERLIFSEQINVSKNPVLRWNFRNAVPYYGGNDDCKLMKNKSLDSIDGAVATLMGLAMYANINFDSVANLMQNLNLNNK